jgi:hypothetical protein
LNLHSRVLGPESADQAGHRVDGKGRERSDLERARLQLEHASNHVAQFVERSLDLAGWPDERFPCGGDPQAAADSVKQLYAEF